MKMVKALKIAKQKREREEERHQKRIAQIDKEYWDNFYNRK